MFKTGDIVIGKAGNGYTYTNDEAIMVVTRASKTSNTMKVCLVVKFGKVIAGDELRSDLESSVDAFEFTVTNSDLKFELVSLETACSRLNVDVDAVKANVETIAEVKSISINYSGSNEDTEIPERPFDMQKFKDMGTFAIADDKLTELSNESAKLLHEFGYHPTHRGLGSVFSTWLNNKSALLNMFSAHPNYNGNFQIVKEIEFARERDQDTIDEFEQFIYRMWRQYHYEEVLFEGHNKRYYMNAEDSIVKINEHIESVNNHFKSLSVDAKLILPEDVTSKLDNIRKDVQRFNDAVRVRSLDNDMVTSAGGILKVTAGDSCSTGLTTCDSYNRKTRIYQMYKVFHSFSDETEVTQAMVEYVNKFFPETHPHKGQKPSKLINKIAKAIGIDTSREYQQMYAKYSDACTPKTIKRYAVLSLNPIDYWTMSFGVNWQSCHTIDKENRRRINTDTNYHGMYSAGTESYMLDGTSAVFYIVESTADRLHPELTPKISRCMFHMANDMLVQGRVYPQSNDDGDGSIYTTIRNIVQEMITTCLKTENTWKLQRGTDACEDVITSLGNHYRDYANFNTCTLSLLKHGDAVTRKTNMVVGHDAICPQCGDEHNSEECIECSDCYHPDDSLYTTPSYVFNYDTTTHYFI